VVIVFCTKAQTFATVTNARIVLANVPNKLLNASKPEAIHLLDALRLRCKMRQPKSLPAVVESVQKSNFTPSYA
jgi:hypothetical protein